MRAIRIHGFGGIDTTRLDEIPRPVPGAGEVLVAVKAAGVGQWDRLMREGRISQTLPVTLGSEVSGTVVALGAGERVAVVTASARSLPALTNSIDAAKVSNTTWTRPPIRSVTAGGAPR
jgi:NADPH:quinone reductase-like Zn-dependent oxidoreductase